MTTHPKDLYGEFQKIVASGDGRAARTFLVAHFEEFPEQIQEELALAFFEDALSTQASAVRQIREMQEQGLQGLEDLAVENRKLDDQSKISELKEQLGTD